LQQTQGVFDIVVYAAFVLRVANAAGRKQISRLVADYAVVSEQEDYDAVVFVSRAACLHYFGAEQGGLGAVSVLLLRGQRRVKASLPRGMKFLAVVLYPS